MRFLSLLQLATVALLSVLISLFPLNSFAESNADPEQIKNILKTIIKDNPEIVLDVLKNNSETVLEIAQQGNIQRRHKMMLAQWKSDAKKPKNVDIAGLPFRGAEKAPVTIVEFSDFTCSYCRQSEVIVEELLAKYGNRIKVVFKPLPKEEVPVSVAAAKYSQAAFLQDREKGWNFYQILFSEPSALESGESFLKSVASRTGLDYKKLQADASSKKIADILNNASKEADKLDISGTPYFLVNNLVIRGAVPKDVFEEAIKFALSLKK